MIHPSNTGTLPPSAATLGHPATAARGPAGGGITATRRFGFGRAFAWLLLAFGLLSAAQAQVGSTDSFNPAFNATPTCTAQQPDGKVLFGGIFTTLNSGTVSRLALARVNADGSADTTFNANITAGTVFCIAVQPDGKILIAGGSVTIGGVAPAITRLNADGSLDSSFATTAITSTTTTRMLLQPDGKILVWSISIAIGVYADNSPIARLNADGSRDTTFNVTIGAQPDVVSGGGVTALVLQQDGKVVYGYGSVTSTYKRIGRLNANGTTDTAFNSNVPATLTGVGPGSPGGIAIQRDGRIVFTSAHDLTASGGRNGINRLMPDGTLDTTWAGATLNSTTGVPQGGTIGLSAQADGKLVVFGNIVSGTYNGMTRLDAGGSLDSTFAPSFLTSALGPATLQNGLLQADGKVIGIGSGVGIVYGVNRVFVARLNNDAATQSLAATSTSTVTWTRGGSAPDAYAVYFENSTDAGATWTRLTGNATRVSGTGNWELTGQSLTGSGQLRATGFFGYWRNGGNCGSLVQQTASYSLTVPEIAVISGGVNIADGGLRNFGSVSIGSTGSLTFIITNSGVDPLNLTGTPKVALAGANPEDFNVSVQPISPVATNGSTTFTVRFSPQGGGARTASLSIANDDADENPFDLVLTGTGNAPEIAVEQPAGTGLTSGTSTTAFGNVSLGSLAVKTFTVKNTGASALTLGAVTFSGANASDFTANTSGMFASVPAAGETTFTVTYTPSAAGGASATLSLVNDDTTGGEAPFLIALSGSGSTSSQVASFGSPGSVTGGWVNGGNFTIGTVGTANPANNWPASQSPDKATDGDVNTQFLLFQGSNAGLILSPANASLAYNRLAFTTAGDATERDPASYIIYGSTSALTTISGANIPVSSLTVITSGTLTLPGARGAGPTVVQFANTIAYASYVVVFPTVKNVPASTITQIAEVKLSQGMNAPNAIAMGTARGGQLVGGTFTFGTSGNTGNQWPAGQSPDNALDGDVNANFLLFRNVGMGLIASPAGGAAAVNRLSFWTAGDAPERDPISYAVYGFNTVVTQSTGDLTVGAAIATGTLTLPTNRLAGPVTVSFVNNTAYASYLVVFPAVRSAPDITQIAEVQFGYVSPYTPPAGTDKTLTVVAGSTNTLTLADWGFTDPLDNPSNNFAAVKITTLPATGTLQVDGVNATAGQTVAFQPTSPAGTTWTARGGPVPRKWTSIASSADGSKLAAVASFDKIYTSTDSGLSWTARLTDANRFWTSVASSADGSKLAAVAQFDKIYTSTDSGLSWTARESSRQWFSIASSVDGSKLAAVVNGGQIYTSTDSGLSWTQRESSRNWTSIASSANGTKLAAVVGGGEIYTSTDSGVSWTGHPATGGSQWASIASSADGNKLAAVVGGLTIFTSTDSGATWTARATDVNRAWVSIASSADGSKLAAVVNGGQIFTSTDSGLNWTARDSNRKWTSITSSADGGKLAAVVNDTIDGGFIYTSAGPLPAITYTVPAGTGSASFTFQVQDDGAANNLDLSPNTLTFNYAPNNAAPTDITLSNATLAENNAANATVGTLTATDVDSGDTHTFTLVAGAGSTDNAAFTITGSTLKLNAAADFETKSSYAIRVRATDSGAGNLTFEKQLTITITDVVENTAPVITTPTSASLLATAATLGGNVTADGGATVTERGVVYALTSANANPLIAGSGVTKVTASGTTGVFTASVTGLTASSGYSFKAYASNSVGTTYTSVATFTTAAPPNAAPSFALPASGPTGEEWTSRDSRRNWVGITSSADGNKLAAVVQNGLGYTSVDSGVTWTSQAGSGTRVWSCITSSADGSKLAAAVGQAIISPTTSGFIYTSTDSGVTWTEQSAAGSRIWVAITSSTDGSKLAAVASGGQIYISADSGVTWLARESTRVWASIACSADGSKLAAVDGGGSGNRYIYTSTDSGMSWTAQTAAGSRQWSSIASSADGSKLAAASGGFVYTSTDSGVSWTQRTVYHSGIISVTSSGDGSKLAVACSNPRPLFTSTDGGATWIQRDGYRSWRSITSSADGSKLAAVNQTGNIFTSVPTPPDVRVLPGSGLSSTAAFASAISPGPVADAGQTVSFLVSTDNSGLFTTPPALAGNGTLTFTPGATFGVATVTVTAVDTGGTTAGGVDTSAPQTFTITVAPVAGMTLDIVFDPGTGKTTLSYSGNWGVPSGPESRDSVQFDRSDALASFGGPGEWGQRELQDTRLGAGGGEGLFQLLFATPVGPLPWTLAPELNGQISASAFGGDFWGFGGVFIYGPPAMFTPTGRISGYQVFDVTLSQLGLTSGTSGVIDIGGLTSVQWTATSLATAPLVTTPTSASVLATTATLGGNVTADGGATVTERGVVYALTSANANPLIAGSGVTKVTASGTTGVFTVSVTGLTASSGYSFKAYASNSVGTTYTSVATFTTAAPPNAAPTNITLSNATLAENNAANATVGTLTATDADSGDTHTFTLVTGTGSTDNAAFTITGSALKLNAAADFETQSSYAIRVRATDSGAGNLTFDKQFTITITNINEAPVAVADSVNRPNNTKVAKVLKTTLLANDTDPEVTDTLSLTAVGSALPSGSTVALVGNFVVYSAPATNSGNGSFTYTLSDGAGGHSVTGTVTVTQVTATGTSTGTPNALRIVASGGNFTTTYIGVPGDSYRVQFTTTTTPPYAWQEFSPPAVFTAPANGVFSQTDVQPANPVRLYRAVSNP